MTKWIGIWLMVLRLKSAMVGNDLYGHMCVFLAGGFENIRRKRMSFHHIVEAVIQVGREGKG